MARAVGAGLAPAALLFVVAGLAAQGEVPPERPKVHVPVRAVSRQEMDHREALKLFGVAALQERRNQLVEAARTLEEAVRLDPEAAAPLRALVPLYLALERGEDALAGCRRVLELDPDDAETAFLYARQLRRRDRAAEARAVLTRAAARPSLGGKPVLQVRVSFELAQLCEEASDWEGAETNYRKVAAVFEHPEALLEQGGNRLEVEAQAAEAWERLGGACLKAGHTDRAQEAFREAYRRDPVRASRLALHLAEALAREGRPADALARLEEYLRGGPQGVEGYELKTRLLRDLGRGGEVVSALEEAAGHDRHNAALWLLLAREYARAGQADKAEKAYLWVIEELPGADAYRGLFALYRDRPDGGGLVLERFDRAVRGATADKDGGGGPRPGEASQAANARAMLQVLRGDAALVAMVLPAAQQRLEGRDGLASGTRALLATLAARTKQLDAAERLYRACLADAGPNEHEVYQGLLTVLRRARKNEEVLRLCERGLAHAEATNRVLFHLYRAEAHAALGHDREALAAADAAVADAGEKERLHCRLERAQLLTQVGRHAAAAAECRALLKEYNQAGDAREVRAVLSAVYSAAHDYPRAEEQLRLILEADPADATACNDLGYLWADQGKNLPEAERLVRKALDLDREQRRGGTALGLEGEEDNAAFIDSLGWVLFRRGRTEDARRELERAAALPGGDDDPVVWDHLGDVCHRLGRTDRAAAAWRKALELYEQGARRRNDGRYDDIKQKLGLTGK
jgi:tetratricopeptide (TPR) repeat protein